MWNKKDKKRIILVLLPTDSKVSVASFHTPYLSPLNKLILLSPVYESAASSEQWPEAASWNDGSTNVIKKYVKTTTELLITLIDFKPEKKNL